MLYHVKQKLPNNDILKLKMTLTPLVSCYIVNHDFLILHTAHFDKNVVLPLLVFETLGYIYSLYLFYNLNNVITLICNKLIIYL